MTNYIYYTHTSLITKYGVWPSLTLFPFTGYSNESPENHNHSSDGPHLHGYARNLPTPPPDPPGHQSTPRTGSHRSSLVGSSHPSSASSSSRGSRSSSQRQRINPDAVLQAHAVSLTQYLPASSQNSSHHLSLPVNGISATSSPNPGERERLHPADTEDEEMALKLRYIHLLVKF